jgi:signal transduction histidine kinase
LTSRAPYQLDAAITAAMPNTNPKIIPIREMSDAEGLFGFLVFGWSGASPGERRFESAELLWTFLLQSLIFKKAALQQHALRGSVFSMVAHNLGAPVFQLCSDARVLVDRFPELEQNDEVRFAKYDQILRQARHMHGIIDAILSIDGRAAKLNLKPVSLALITYEVVRTMRLEARESNVAIAYERPDDDMIAKTIFVTDEIRVYDIMLNLVSNAVKYSSEGGIVHVSTSVTPRGALLTVHDTGPEVPEEEKKLIFQPFFRGRHAIKIPGLGLGLFVADIYARALQGRIAIPREQGEGKSFVVFLPTYEKEEPERAHSAHR